MADGYKKKMLKMLGAELRAARLKRHLSLKKVAAEAEISQGNLSDIEQGKRDPRFCTLRSIAHAVGIPIAKLLRRL